MLYIVEYFNLISNYFQQEDDETRTSEVKQYLAYNIQRLKDSNHFQSQA